MQGEAGSPVLYGDQTLDRDAPTRFVGPELLAEWVDWATKAATRHSEAAAIIRLLLKEVAAQRRQVQLLRQEPPQHGSPNVTEAPANPEE